MAAYKDAAVSQALKIRWISVQCYEIALPNGKVIVTDPFIWDGSNLEGKELTEQEKRELKVYKQTGFTVNDFTGADYIIISHAHGDHCNIVGDLWNRFYGRVLVPADAATEVARVYNIPYGAIYPIYPGNTYYFDDFTLKVYPGAHDNRSFREGYFLRPDDPANLTQASEEFNIPTPNMTGPLGYMYVFNFMIETLNNFRIDFSAGRDFEEHVKQLGNDRPNIMLRHRIRNYTPEYYASQMEMMGAQIMMPLHHNNARAKGEDLNEFFDQVNQVLEAHHYAGKAFNPEPYVWYEVCTSIKKL